MITVTFTGNSVCSIYLFFFKFQAFIFWVVDNFLKRHTKHTKTVYVNGDDHSVRYSRTADTARLYNRIERIDDGDSDIILTDDDPDLRRRNDSTDMLIS